jgi:hypothetical protein
MTMKFQAYRARRPKLSTIWQCLDAYFDAFLDICPLTYKRDYGFLRPVIPEVVGKLIPVSSHFSVRLTHRPRHFKARGSSRTLG